MPLIPLAPNVFGTHLLLRKGARFIGFTAALIRLSASLLAALLAWQPTVSAQEAFPSRALKVIVPQPPGGGFDFVGRTLADKLATQLKQPVVVENRPGSGTLVGTDAAAKSAADGYTLLVGSVSNLALNPGLYPTLPYDPIKDFEPLGIAVSYSYTLIARRDLPLSSLSEVIAFAKSNPGKLTYASGGNGSGQHVLAAALWHLAGVKLTHVPYRGAQAAYTDLLGGRVDLFFDLSPTARPQVDAGTVKALAVSGGSRSPLHSQVPTVRETGVAPLELESWFGLFVPARIPTTEATVLQRELMVAMTSRDVVERFERAGGRPLSMGAAESRQLVARDVERWTKLVRELGLKAD